MTFQAPLPQNPPLPEMQSSSVSGFVAMIKERRSRESNGPDYSGREVA